MPVVEWPYATMGQPPLGGSPCGTKTVPETCVVPSNALVDAYVIRAASDVTSKSRRSSVGIVLADNNAPAPDPLKSPFNGTPDAATGAGGGAEAVALCSRPIA